MTTVFATPAVECPVHAGSRVAPNRRPSRRSTSVAWGHWARVSLLASALWLCAPAVFAQSDGEMSMQHGKGEPAAGMDDGAMEWVGPHASVGKTGGENDTAPPAPRTTVRAPRHALNVNASAHPLGAAVASKSAPVDPEMQMEGPPAGGFGDATQAGLLPARAPTASEADARAAAEATLRAAAMKTANAASNVSREQLLAQPQGPLVRQQPVSVPTPVAPAGNTRAAAVAAQQQADATAAGSLPVAVSQPSTVAAAGPVAVATPVMVVPVQQTGAQLPMALPPLPGPGTWAAPGTTQWIAPVSATPVMNSASDIEPVEPSDQPLGGYAGDQFERLGIDATHMRESAWRQLGSHGQPLPTGDFAWELRIYRVAKGRVELTYSGNARATPLDPSWLQGPTHAQVAALATAPQAARRKRGQPGAITTLTDDAAQSGAGRNGESAAGQLKAELVWRPKSAFWGDAVELALSTSVVVGMDEIEGAKGIEHFPRESRTKFLGFFEMQEQTPQMAWLPLDPSERIEESENGSTGGWLIAVGGSGAFARFDVQKAVANAREGHF